MIIESIRLHKAGGFYPGRISVPLAIIFVYSSNKYFLYLFFPEISLKIPILLNPRRTLVAKKYSCYASLITKVICLTIFPSNEK
jgi:hypothetical protein